MKTLAYTYSFRGRGVKNSKNFANPYSYDVHGNVSTLLQDNPLLSSIAQRFKRTDYDYDLLSGKVNDAHYQNGQPDAFHHHFLYDADNRVTEVYTSRFPNAYWPGYKDAFWDRDAKYYYYKHNSLARIEIGDNNLQGVDYAYTIQGQIKGVNSEALQPTYDMGKDGLYASNNCNKTFAKDAFGYSLKYYDGDYDAIYKGWKTDSTNRFTASQYLSSHAASDLPTHRYNLYNGNVSTMVSSITNPGVNTSMPLASTYKYDQLNRIIQSQSFQELQGVTNNWNNENNVNSSLSPAYYNKFSYDANGNIQSQLRKDVNGTNIDSLIYNYSHDSNHELFQNRLYSVNDNVPSARFGDDIDDQGAFDSIIERVNVKNNYSYDEIGQLKKDSAEQIQSITWTVYNKIKSVTRYAGSSKKNFKFDYDASGEHRIAKHVYTSANVWISSTFYVRDARGNVMTTYEQKNVGTSHSFRVKERDIYGVNRLGALTDSIQLIGAIPDTINYSRVLGQKEFEMSNHLGNVLTVISDKKVAQDPTVPLSLYNSPNLVRTTIDSLSGMKMQPLAQNGGVNFAFKSIIGQSYQVDFYVNLGNTNSGDALSFDYPTSTGNSLSSTGHYTFNFSATDTLSSIMPYYAATGSTPNHYFLFDSLKIVATGTTLDSIRGYNSQLVSISDYYPFGSPITGRTWNLNSIYRYGFNGKEKDDDLKGSGNSYDYGVRMFDPRLGRFLSLDPLTKHFAELSPYQYASNTPIQSSDLDGLESHVQTFETNDDMSRLKLIESKDLEKQGPLGAGYLYRYKLPDGNYKSYYYDKVYQGNVLSETYVGPDNPQKKGKDDYGQAPQDYVDYAAFKHDKAYDKFGAKGRKDAENNLDVLAADKELVLDAVEGVLLYHAGAKDPITGKKATKSLGVTGAAVALYFGKIVNAKQKADDYISQQVNSSNKDVKAILNEYNKKNKTNYTTTKTRADYEKPTVSSTGAAPSSAPTYGATPEAKK